MAQQQGVKAEATEAKPNRVVNLGNLKKLSDAEIQSIINDGPAKEKRQKDKVATSIAQLNERLARKMKHNGEKIAACKKLLADRKKAVEEAKNAAAQPAAQAAVPPTKQQAKA